MGFLYKNQKISTGIWGLNRLLFGGVQLQSFEEDQFIRPLTIVIEGESGSSRALFAMQLLHGLCKSLYNIKDTYNKGYTLLTPIYFSPSKWTNNLQDMLLDIYICSIKYTKKDKCIFEKKSCSELFLRLVLNDYRLNQTATLFLGELSQLEL